MPQVQTHHHNDHLCKTWNVSWPICPASSIRQTAGDAFSRNMKRVFVFILGTIDCFTQELAPLLKLLKLSQ